MNTESTSQLNSMKKGDPRVIVLRELEAQKETNNIPLEGAKGSYAKEEVDKLKKEHKLRFEETKERVQGEEFEQYKRTASRRTGDRDTWAVSRKPPLNAHSEIV
jgi:predicted CopG family antitoxin